MTSQEAPNNPLPPSYYPAKGAKAAQSSGPVEEDTEKRLRSAPELAGVHITAYLTSKNTMALQGTVLSSHQKKLALKLAKQHNEAEGHFLLQDEISVVPARQFSYPGNILVAGNDGKLHLQPYQAPQHLITAEKINALQQHHLQAAIDASKVLFPKNIRLLSVNLNGGYGKNRIIVVNLNHAFLNTTFWKRQPNMRLAIYCIVNNIGNMDEGKGQPLPVQIIVEGKKVKDFRGFDISKPHKPDMSFVVAE